MDETFKSKFPEDWRKEFLGHSGEVISTAHLSGERTDLASARSHMANERTHLAYLRTSLSLMSFGITLNRFSIYLRQNKWEEKTRILLYETEFVGLGMVLLGVAILAWALYHYRKTATQIDHYTYHSPKQAISFLTIAIIFIGGLSALWMIINQIPGD